MSNTKFVVGICILFLLLGTQHRREAIAATPKSTCPKYQCKTVGAYWDGISVNELFVPGGSPGAYSSNAYLDIFTPLSKENLPVLPPQGRVESWTFPGCIPTCGKGTSDGHWAVPQEVAGAGIGQMSIVMPRTKCTAAVVEGLWSVDQSNNNPGGLNPPGYVPTPP